MSDRRKVDGAAGSEPFGPYAEESGHSRCESVNLPERDRVWVSQSTLDNYEDILARYMDLRNEFWDLRRLLDRYKKALEDIVAIPCDCDGKSSDPRGCAQGIADSALGDWA